MREMLAIVYLFCDFLLQESLALGDIVYFEDFFGDG